MRSAFIIFFSVFSIFTISSVFSVDTSGFLSPAAAATPKTAPEPGMRLIELRPGKTRWATPAELHELSENSHRLGYCGGFMDITDWQKPLPPLARTRNAISLRKEPMEKVFELFSKLHEQNLRKIVERLSHYKNRYYKNQTGVDSATWIKERFEELTKLYNRKDIKAELYHHPQWPQPSVIATIPGHGPHANEIVILGGHLDSIHWALKGWGKAPGADDNASGMATILETFRVLIDPKNGFRPERTIQFMGYAAEEVGLRGSAEIAKHYREQKRNVVGVIQFDMTMYPGSLKQITLIEDPFYTDSALNQFVRNLVEKYLGVTPRKDRCGYACSDHASWARAGYPSAMPFETGFKDSNPDIHTADDTTKNLNSAWGLQFAKIAVAFAVEMAKVD